jgi:hypothetical protein
MRNILQFVLITTLVLFTFGAWSCPKNKDGTKIKPSQATVLAQNLASIPVAFRVTGEITEVLTTDGDFSVASRDVVRHGLKRSLEKLDKIAADVEGGKYDAADVKAKINLIITEFETAIRDGSAGIKNPQAQRRWLDYTILARLAFNDITRLVDALKPLPPSIVEDQSRSPSQLEITATGIAQILNYSVIAALDLKNIRDDTDVLSVWAKYKAQSQVAHAALR